MGVPDFVLIHDRVPGIWRQCSVKRSSGDHLRDLIVLQGTAIPALPIADDVWPYLVKVCE